MNTLKYLVTWRLLPVPPGMAKTAVSLLEATKAWMEKEMQPGGCIVGAWQKTEGTGGIAIAENESNDALYKKLMECPSSILMEYTVTPLTDIKLAIETGINIYKKMAGE